MSNAEKELEELLNQVFPGYQRVYQFPIRCRNTTLYIDFVIPTLLLAFELDGRQHSEEVSHFYKNRRAFLHARQNDRFKEEWCEENAFTLVRFSHKEKINKSTLYAKIETSNRSK